MKHYYIILYHIIIIIIIITHCAWNRLLQFVCVISHDLDSLLNIRDDTGEADWTTWRCPYRFFASLACDLFIHTLPPLLRQP